MDVQAILAEVDRDGDGHIDYDEFVAMMMKVLTAGSGGMPLPSTLRPRLHAEMVPSPFLSHPALVSYFSAHDHKHVGPRHYLRSQPAHLLVSQAVAVQHLLFVILMLPLTATLPC